MTINTNWTRRGFLVRSAVGTGAVISGEAAIQLLGTTRAWAAGDFATDVDVLNYALTLEHLEATFYQQGNASGVITDSTEKDVFALIQSDEEAHVKAIGDTVTKLGGTPVAKPAVAFPSGTFGSRASYIKTAKVFEETGVGAYLGAAGSIQSKEVLQAAAGIFGVEARHAAAIGYLAGLAPEGGIYMGATETAKSKGEVLAAVMPFLGGMPNTGFAPGGVANWVPAGVGAVAGAGLLLAGLRRRGLVAIMAGAALLGGSGAALAAPILHPTSFPGGAHGTLPAIKPAPDRYNPTPPPKAASPPAALRIPSIGVDAPVEPVGVTAGYAMATPSQTSNTGWYAQGAVPGEAGDAVLDGHLDTESGAPAVFARLDQLKPGAAVVVVFADGRETRFAVSRIARVPGLSRPAGLFETEGPPRLTLITCAGAWDARKGTYADRLVVDAIPTTN